MEYFSDECYDNGDLLLFMSNLQVKKKTEKLLSSFIYDNCRS
jgi:hypothetical protein